MCEWFFNDEVFDENKIKEYIGFVYIITNNINGKKYIGKKNFFKKRKKIVSVSDWKTYYGSSETLKNDIKKYYKTNYIIT